MAQHNYPLKYWWIVLIVVPIVVAIIGIIPNLFEDHKKENPVSQTWILKGRILGGKTELPIRRAKVSFEIQGVMKITDTDSEGVYRVDITSTDPKLVGRVRVEATGYESYDRSIEVSVRDAKIDDIILKPLTPTPTPIFVPTATPTLPPTPVPTVTPIPTATPTATPTPPPPSDETAVLIVDENNAIHARLTSQITAILQKKGVKLTTSPIFTDAVIHDGTFDRLFQGHSVDAQHFQPYFKYGMLGRTTVSFEKHPELENTITALVTLEMHIVSSRSGVSEESLFIRQKGVAFSATEAEARAIENVLKEVEPKIEQLVTMF